MKSIRIAIFIVCALFMSTAMAGDQVKGPFWQAFLQLGYNPQKKVVDRDKAMDNIQDLMLFAKQVLYNFTFETKTKRFVDQVRGRLSSFDLHNLYQMLPQSDSKSKWKGMGVTGKRRSGKFEVELVDPKMPVWVRNEAFPGKMINWHQVDQLGDFAFRIFAKPGKNETFAFQTELQSSMGKLPYQGILSGVETLMKGMEKVAVGGDTPPTWFWRKHQISDRIEALFTYSFARDLPKLFEVTSEYVDVASIGSLIQGKKGKYLKVHLALRPKLKAFKRDFPELFKILRNLQGIFQVRTRIYDEHGHLLALTYFDSKSFTFHAKFLSKNGRLLVCKAPWDPLDLKGISLKDVGARKFKIILDFKLNFRGIQIAMRAIHFKLKYSFQPKTGPQLTIRFNEPPRVMKIEGDFLGTLILWLIDLVIPSNLDTLFKDFFTTLAKSNGGKGMEVRIALRPDAKGNTRIWLSSKAQVLANGTIKFGFSFQSQSGLANPKLYLEVRRFGRRFWQAFLEDFFRFRDSED